MTVAWFAHFHAADPAGPAVSEAELARVLDIVAEVPGLHKGLVFTPWALSDLYFDDGPSPHLALELYFDGITDLERALAADGALQPLAAPSALPTLAGARVEEQAMLARAYPVPDGRFRTPQGAPHCSFLVHYPGEAEDLNRWLIHYVASHTPIMATFPEIREIEVCSRIDWMSEMPWQRANHMQRNKVVYDDGEALRRAMMSDVLPRMRADFHGFPPFTGNNLHFAMATYPVALR